MKKLCRIILLGILGLTLVWGPQVMFFPSAGREAFAETEKKSKNSRVGKASWYSEKSPGVNLRTASNEIFDDKDLTCAMWGVPFNQRVKVTNRANGKSVVVRVNDRGPHFRFVNKGRIIDLTKEAFSQLSDLKKGLIEVELQFF